MAKTLKIRDIDIFEEEGTFTTFLRKFSRGSGGYNFEDIHSLRQLLTNEKARILHTIKTQKPTSIYELAKSLKRDFKSVNEDIRLLEKFGFIDLISEKTGKRVRLKPILVTDEVRINIKL